MDSKVNEEKNLKNSPALESQEGPPLEKDPAPNFGPETGSPEEKSLQGKKTNRLPFFFQLISALILGLSLFVLLILRSEISFQGSKSYWSSAGLVRYLDQQANTIAHHVVFSSRAALWAKVPDDAPICVLLGLGDDQVQTEDEISYLSALIDDAGNPEAQKKDAYILKSKINNYSENPQEFESLADIFYKKKDLEAWAGSSLKVNSAWVYIHPLGDELDQEEGEESPALHFITPDQIQKSNADLEKLVAGREKAHLQLVEEKYKPLYQESLLAASGQNVNSYQMISDALQNLIRGKIADYQGNQGEVPAVSKNILYTVESPKRVIDSNQKERDLTRPWTAPIIYSNVSNQIGEGLKSRELSVAFQSNDSRRFSGSGMYLPLGWTLRLQIDTSLPEYDDAHALNQKYPTFYKAWWTALALTLLSAIVWAISLGIFLKRTSKQDRPKLAKFEGAVPIEFYLLFFVGLLGSVFGLGISAAHPGNPLSFFTGEWMVLVAGVSLIFELLGLYLLSAMVRKWKQGRFYQGSLCHWIAHFFSSLNRYFREGRGIRHFNLFSYLLWGIIGGSIFLFMAMAGSPAMMVLVFIAWAISGIWLTARRDAEFNRLLERMKELARGNFHMDLYPEDFHGANQEVARTLNQINEGMEAAIQNELKSQLLQTELITNVSHDLRTPLTSIINYVQLLKDEPLPDDGHAREYLDVLDQKSSRLKLLINDLIEASKAASGVIDYDLQEIDFREACRQILAEREEGWEKKDLIPVIHLSETPLLILADGEKLSRVLENLLVNAQKYSQGQTRVYIDLKTEGEDAVFTVKNISSEPLNVDVEELLRRFSRGNQARTEEGSGLGLSIAETFTQGMNGKLKISIDGDLFKAEVSLPLAKSKS